MIVAIFKDTYVSEPNFLEFKIFDFLPSINSIMMVNNKYYKVEHYCPITFQSNINKDIMCLFTKEIYFDSEYDYGFYPDFFAKHKSFERKYKIQQVLE